jgi:hypothetical protein
MLISNNKIRHTSCVFFATLIFSCVTFLSGNTLADTTTTTTTIAPPTIDNNQNLTQTDLTNTILANTANVGNTLSGQITNLDTATANGLSTVNSSLNTGLGAGGAINQSLGTVNTSILSLQAILNAIKTNTDSPEDALKTISPNSLGYFLQQLSAAYKSKLVIDTTTLTPKDTFATTTVTKTTSTATPDTSTPDCSSGGNTAWGKFSSLQCYFSTYNAATTDMALLTNVQKTLLDGFLSLQKRDTAEKTGTCPAGYTDKAINDVIYQNLQGLPTINTATGKATYPGPSDPSKLYYVAKKNCDTYNSNTFTPDSVIDGTSPAFKYIEYASGMNIPHIKPPTSGNDSLISAYTALYQTISAVQTFGAAVLSQVYVDSQSKTSDSSPSNIQILVQQATDSTWC